MGCTQSAKIDDRSSEKMSTDRAIPAIWNDRYQVMDQIGSGMSGKVYRVSFTLSDTEYALKVMPFTPDLLPEEIEDMRRECRLLKKLSHENIIRYVDSVEENECLYLVTQLLKGKELFDFVTSRTTYLESDARECTRALLKAIKYLHDQDIVHRDIKPENLILENPNELHSMKLIDFGLASKLEDPAHGITKAAGTPGYLPPEALHTNPRYGLGADTWAVGVVAYIMLCGYPPFYGDTDIQLFRSIRREAPTFDPSDWSDQSSFSKDFVLKLLEKNPEKRLTASECLKHPWITSKKLTDNNMKHTLNNLRSTMAKARLKKSIKAVIFANRCARLRLGQAIEKSLEVEEVTSKSGGGAAKDSEESPGE